MKIKLHPVSATSCTERYFAIKLFVDNWRWEGVSFCLPPGLSLTRKPWHGPRTIMTGLLQKG